MSELPVLKVGDLVLRPTAAADEPGIAAAGRDPAIRQMPWFGAGFTDAWARPFVQRAIEEWASDRNRLFSIVDGSGAYLGSVNVGLVKDGAIEIAYWILPNHRAHGVATQAV